MLRPSWLEWLYLAVGLALVWHYRFLYDDAFVYFRYVDNALFLDLGLVYNQGEYVEGYTSPLWTLLLLALRATGLPWPTVVAALALTGFALLWLLLVALGRRVAPEGPHRNLPLAFLAPCYSAASWQCSGMEATLLQIAAPCFALFVFRPGSLPLQVAVALAPLARHELVLPLGVCALWAWWRERRFPWRLGLLSGGFLGGWLLFRVWYYAELLPNTFYLKNDVAWAQGWAYLLDTALVYPLLPLLGACAISVAWLHRRGSPSAFAAERVVLLAAALPVALYVMRIGGAPIHYRYLAFPFFLVVCASAGVAEGALARLARPGRKRLGVALALAVFFWSAASHPRQLDRHPLRPGVQVREVDGILEAAYHRAAIDFGGRGWSRQANPERFARYLAERPGFAYRSVAAEGWCERAYRAFDVKILHAWGLTDAVLARVDTPATRPGHKPRLVELARELVPLHRDETRFGPGVHRRWVEARRAPGWVAANLAALEILERKIYNRHHLGENLVLAFTPVPRLELP